jgi:hypothetical protein
MMIQLRLMGSEKEKVKQLIYGICKDCNITSGHIVPHLSLYGDFKTSMNNASRIDGVIREVAKQYDSLPFKINGYDYFRGERGMVCALNVVPSIALRDFRLELSKKVYSIAPSPKPWDREGDFKFHISIAHHLSQYRYNKIHGYIEGEPSLIHKLLPFIKKPEPLQNPYLPAVGTRVTFLHDNRTIRCEYDMVRKRMLSRNEALSQS